MIPINIPIAEEKSDLILAQLPKLIRMSDIPATEVQWLWPPYIPRGKITIIQGDPGDGKTTFVLALIALLTTGAPLPGCDVGAEPISVLYQTAEDGLADTIKPRLEQNHADCSRVMVIDDSQSELTLDDDRLIAAIEKCGAQLLVFDPLQAYLGTGTDMHRANEVRNILKRLHNVAEQTSCAVVLIGHMNKMQGAKHNYRLLGSVDFTAAVRSVLVVGRVKDDATLRIAAHSKSNLAPEGQSIQFRLDPVAGFQWEGFCNITADMLLSKSGARAPDKTAMATELIYDLLKDGPVPSSDLLKKALAQKISKRTPDRARSDLGIAAFRKGDKWYVALPGQMPDMLLEEDGEEDLDG